ncbi:hypothetical protein HOU02_gp175 [Caulobacter phage CcrBL9]|uniref:Uncharacterized protein n=1 Tax=Caulobacter phage CcrBL9 TaxID=2283270 RepID=A0A385ED16_9CAUD|nr:hypothetical protein HOU02_gp010 [Caulobacter phage CcrBL9]YP_009810180.1 hypothetical protein HOU02_gp175 [Caulobacter phage CcrBL9]AXQ69034.1 hypothetical protein CcrBL9_gp010 [Caulobacter phage CcrBL9]AXQ69550.1 hypothetical protein CcrBL9_gp526 [Caulobacter phage CcrBL9]
MDDTYPPLTPGQQDALVAFADQHGGLGEAWKEALGDAWRTCSEPEALKADLRTIRNTYGPSWLYDEYAWGWRPTLPAWERAGRWTDTPPEPTPGKARWSAAFDPPAIGERVRVTTNGLGWAKVTGYFVEGDWLGVIVKLEAPADWYVKQNGGNVPGHSFGTEIALTDPA